MMAGELEGKQLAGAFHQLRAKWIVTMAVGRSLPVLRIHFGPPEKRKDKMKSTSMKSTALVATLSLFVLSVMAAATAHVDDYCITNGGAYTAASAVRADGRIAISLVTHRLLANS